MDTVTLEKQLEQIISTGAGYGPEFLPVLGETLAIVKSINQGAKTAEQYFQLGTMLLELQDQQMALSAFQTAWQTNPADVNSATYIGLILEQLGNIDQAIQVYQKINEIVPDNTEIVAHLLALAYDQNDIKKVLTLCQHFLSKKQQYASVYDYVSRVFYASGNYGKALEYIKEAATIEPNNPDYVNRLIHHLYKESYYKEVIGFSDYLQQSDQASIPIRLLLPNSLAAIGNLSEARTEFSQLLKKQRQDSDRFAVLAEIALFHANYESDVSKANLINRAILRRDPDNVQALTNIAMFEHDQKKGLALYKRAYELNPVDTKNRLNYGLKLLEAGYLEQGFKLYECRVEVNKPFLKDQIKMPTEKLPARLFVWNEQGLGDQFIWSWLFQFLGQDRVNAKIQIDSRLLSLMIHSFPSLTFTGDSTIDLYQNENLSSYDGCILMASIGAMYTDKIYSAQAEIEAGQVNPKGHLLAEPNLVADWRSRIESITTGPTIGVCWRSSLRGDFRNLNYLDVYDIVRLFSGMNVTVVNLQYAYTEDELQVLRDGLGVKFIHFDSIDLMNDQEALAALIMSLDGVFSVATAVFALSGALGQKTFSPAGSHFLGKGYHVMLSGIQSIHYGPDFKHCVPFYRKDIENYLREKY